MWSLRAAVVHYAKWENDPSLTLFLSCSKIPVSGHDTYNEKIYELRFDRWLKKIFISILPIMMLALRSLISWSICKCHCIPNVRINLLTPNVNYSGLTATLTSKVAFYIFTQQIYVLNILNIVYTLRFFLFKMQFVS